MSPSRRRAIGAVRGFASRSPASPRRVPRCGMVPRLAAGESNRTPRPARLWGAHRDAPRKTLSVCYSPCPRAIFAPLVPHFAALLTPPRSPRSSPHRSIACGFASPHRPATAKTERMLPIFQDRSAREFTLSVREQFATISIPHFYRLFRRKLAKKTSERSYSRFFSSPCRDFQRRICSPNPPGKQQN